MEFINKVHEKVYNEFGEHVAKRYAEYAVRENTPEEVGILTSVMESFMWSTTTEGVKYWTDIHCKIWSVK